MALETHIPDETTREPLGKLIPGEALERQSSIKQPTRTGFVYVAGPWEPVTFRSYNNTRTRAHVQLPPKLVRREADGTEVFEPGDIVLTRLHRLRRP